MMKTILGGCVTMMMLAGAATSFAKTEAPRGDHAHAVGHRHHEHKTPEQVIERFDANKDGLIQRAEVPEKRQAWFDRVDANHDDLVTKDEIVAFRAAHHAAHEKK